MHVRLFVNAHQDQRRIEGDRTKSVGSHPMLGTAMMGGHHRHACDKAAKHLPKKHRIKWHDSPPGNCLTLSPTYCVPQLAPPVWRGGVRPPIAPPAWRRGNYPTAVPRHSPTD